MMISKGNASTFGRDFYDFAMLQGEFKTGPLGLVKDHYTELCGLAAQCLTAAAKVADLQAKGDTEGAAKVPTGRAIRLGHWYDSPRGQLFKKEYDLLNSTKKRSVNQQRRFKTMQDEQRAMNINLERVVDTAIGVERLRAQGINVDISQLPKTNRYVCDVYGIGEKKAQWSATKLQDFAAWCTDEKLGKITTEEAISAEMKASAAQSNREGSAGEEHTANGDSVDVKQLANAITSLDTSIAKHENAKGDGVKGGKPANAALHMLWARLDAMMSDDDKEIARKAYAGEGDEAAAA